MSKTESLLNDRNHPDVVRLSKLFQRTLQPPIKRTKKSSSRKKVLPPVTDPEQSAKDAGLKYVTDSAPGLQRRKNGHGFLYLDPAGKKLQDESHLERIRKLAIPPAWTDVWICPTPQGHLQATGRDARRRKQYRYHSRWVQTRDSTKFERMIAFGEHLPQIRKRVDADLSLPGMPKEKILATVVRLLEVTLIRVGNEEYARDNQSYGLTTLRNKHVDVLGSSIRFRFKGKSGKVHDVGIKDNRLARILKRCQEIPGYELFQYIDENGNQTSIDSSDVNSYLREITGEDFTAKDFRTWAGTVLASMAFQLNHVEEEASPKKKKVLECVTMVANLLGNTPSVCRKCYIHPEILQGYERGELIPAIQLSQEQKTIAPVEGLAPEEVAVLTYLKRTQTQ